MASDNLGFSVTPAKLGFALALLAAVSFGVDAISYFKNQEFKDVQQDEGIASIKATTDRLLESIGKLTEKTDELNKTIIRLTVTLEQKAPEKRVESLFENSTAPLAIAVDSK